VIAKRKSTDSLGPLVIDNTEQELVNVVVDDWAKVRGVEVVFKKAVGGTPFVQRRPRNLPAIRQCLAIRIHIQMEQARLTSAEKTALIPLRDVMVVSGLLTRHTLAYTAFCDINSLLCPRASLCFPISSQCWQKNAMIGQCLNC
jgi:hypothetical protein